MVRGIAIRVLESVDSVAEHGTGDGGSVEQRRGL